MFRVRKTKTDQPMNLVVQRNRRPGKQLSHLPTSQVLTQPSVTFRINQSLTTFSGSLCPGRYFTFSWSLFMMSVSFLPLTVSSKTHILTVEANFWSFLTLSPIIFATAEPLQKKQWKRKQTHLGRREKALDYISGDLCSDSSTELRTQMWCRLSRKLFFCWFGWFFNKFIYLFACFWLHWVFVAARGLLQLWRAGATLRCGARASHCGGFSCCRARALGMRASVVVARGLSSCGSLALEHSLSSCGTWA